MRLVLCFWTFLVGVSAGAQHFEIHTVNDTVSLLTLTTAGQTDTLRLNFPVYKFCTGDLNGDGIDEALVGVVKSTRFYHIADRRLFIFKNYDGYIRTLWRGSRVGRNLIDFKVVDDKIRCLMQMEDDNFSIADFSLARFGLQFERFIIENASEQDAFSSFNNE